VRSVPTCSQTRNRQLFCHHVPASASDKQTYVICVDRGDWKISMLPLADRFDPTTSGESGIRISVSVLKLLLLRLLFFFFFFSRGPLVPHTPGPSQPHWTKQKRPEEKYSQTADHHSTLNSCHRHARHHILLWIGEQEWLMLNYSAVNALGILFMCVFSSFHLHVDFKFCFQERSVR
jgi:hypothetical protein